MEFIPPTNPAEYVLASVWERQVRNQYVTKEGVVVASSREIPNGVVPPPVGTWRVDDVFCGLHGREIEQLCELDPDQLLLSEDLVEQNIEGRRWDAERYAEWLAGGLRPPPATVVQIGDGTGRFKIVDGHRRAWSAKITGRSLLAWVSPCMEHPLGLEDSSTGRVMLVGMTYEGIHRKAFPADRLTPTGESQPNSAFLPSTRVAAPARVR